LRNTPDRYRLLLATCITTTERSFI
jgi:hypothetical protein